VSLTPSLVLDNGMVLQPTNKAILGSLLDAYHEDETSAHSALPWLDGGSDIRHQLSNMLHDIETQANLDQLHFWSIHTPEKDEFVGLIGLGDELQSLHSDYNLGYWVRGGFQRQGVAKTSVDSVFSWLNQRGNPINVEIAVHPHNAAGLATAEAICSKWNGERLPDYIGIEFNGRTVPHRLHMIELGRGETA